MGFFSFYKGTWIMNKLSKPAKTLIIQCTEIFVNTVRNKLNQNNLCYSKCQILRELVMQVLGGGNRWILPCFLHASYMGMTNTNEANSTGF